jgi:DNA-binding NarL/FixJ family response regulator
MPLRSLIVDDNASFREEARGLLQEQGLDVIGTAGSSDEAMRQIEELRPDVVLIDIDLGGESGLDLTHRLSKQSDQPAPLMILISTYDEREYADLIAASPAIGFLAKAQLSAEAIRLLIDRASPSDGRPGR